MEGIFKNWKSDSELFQISNNEYELEVPHKWSPKTSAINWNCQWHCDDNINNKYKKNQNNNKKGWLWRRRRRRRRRQQQQQQQQQQQHHHL